MGKNGCSIKDAGVNGRLCYTVQCEGSILMTWGCHNERPQNARLKTTEMYSLTVLGARNPKSRCQQKLVLLEALGKNLSSFWKIPAIFSIPWLIHCLCHHMAFLPVSLWVSPRFFIFAGTPVFGCRVHSTLGWLHLNLSTSAKILFPNKVTVSGLGLQGDFLKDMIQLTIGPEISLKYFVCVLLWGAESSYVIIELLTDRLTEARTIHFLVMFAYKAFDFSWLAQSVGSRRVEGQSWWILTASPVQQ